MSYAWTRSRQFRFWTCDEDMSLSWPWVPVRASTESSTEMMATCGSLFVSVETNFSYDGDGEDDDGDVGIN